MGVSEKPGLLDNRQWAGKAFDGEWAATLSASREVTEPTPGEVLSGINLAAQNPPPAQASQSTHAA